MRLRIAQEGWQRYEPLLRHILGPNFDKMSFASIEDFYSARGHTKWLEAFAEGIASPNTEIAFFLGGVRGLIEFLQLDDKLTLPQIFAKAPDAEPGITH